MSYTDKIQELLNSLPNNLGKIAAYDTGYGLSIVPYCDDSESIDTLFVVQNRYLKLPIPADSVNWDMEWKSGKAIVNKFIKSYNKNKVK